MNFGTNRKIILILNKRMGFVQNLIVGIWYNIILVLFLIIGFILYKCFSSAYLRGFRVGHSAKYNDFLTAYMEELVDTLHELNSSKSDCVLEIKTRIQVLIDETIISSSKTSGIKETPLLFMYYAFKDDIKGGKSNYVKLSNKIFNDDSTVMKIKNKSYKMSNESGSDMNKELMTVLKEGVEKFEIFVKYIESLEDSCLLKTTPIVGDKNECSSSITNEDDAYAIVRLKQLFNLVSYFDQIHTAYETRKSGGIANFKIFVIYMKDYINYVFKEKIPTTWSTFLSDAQALFEKIEKYFVGPAAVDYMTKLPLTLSGEKENFIINPHVDEGDNVEHFINILTNMVKALTSIPKIFQSIAGVVLGLANVVTNPLAFIRYILSVFIGLSLYFMWYIVFVICGFVIFIVFAYVWSAAYKVVITLFWTIMFLWFSIFYMVLTLLDFFTGGYIMKKMRCENLPNSWHTLPGWEYDNKYTRSFFCVKPCAQRFRPGLLMCNRLKFYQTSFCPQQYIYSSLLNSQSFGNVPSGSPVYFKHQASFSYYSKSRASQIEELNDFFNLKVENSGKCNKKFKEYDYLNKSICQNVNLLFNDEDMKSKVNRLCCETYCNLSYDDEDKAVSREKTKLKFCKCYNKGINSDCDPCENCEAKVGEEIPPTSEEGNIYVLVIMYILYLLFFVFLFLVLYHVTTPISNLIPRDDIFTAAFAKIKKMFQSAKNLLKSKNKKQEVSVKVEYTTAPSAPSSIPSSIPSAPSAPSSIPSAPSSIPSAPSSIPSAPSSIPSTPSYASSIPSASSSIPSTPSSAPSSIPSAPSSIPSAPSSIPSAPSSIPSASSSIPSIPSYAPSSIPSVPSVPSSAPYVSSVPSSAPYVPVHSSVHGHVPSVPEYN